MLQIISTSIARESPSQYQCYLKVRSFSFCCKKNLLKIKSLYTNNQRCKESQCKQLKTQKGTVTNEQTNTDTLDPYGLFSRGPRRNMK